MSWVVTKSCQETNGCNGKLNCCSFLLLHFNLNACQIRKKKSRPNSKPSVFLNPFFMTAPDPAPLPLSKTPHVQQFLGSVLAFPLSSCLLWSLSSPWGHLKKYPEKMTISSVTLVGSWVSQTSSVLCVFYWLGIVASSYSCSLVDTALTQLAHLPCLWSQQRHATYVLTFTSALLIDSPASLQWNWNMFPSSCIYKC